MPSKNMKKNHPKPNKKRKKAKKHKKKRHNKSSKAKTTKEPISSDTSHPLAKTCKPNKKLHNPTPKLKIIQKIGNGCFGFVFEAVAIYKNNLRVAWKRMHKNSNRVSRELQMLELVRGTKHCVQLLDFFYTRTRDKPDEVIQNFVMEFCQDNLESLLTMVKSKVFHISFTDVKKVIFQILLGIRELHQLSICHRDLKPENIFYTPNNVIKIGDLGSSKRLRSFDKNTPYVVSRYYRAPELIIGIKTYSLNIDVFSVAVMFYELVTGRLPFKGRSEGQQLVEILKNLGPPPKRIRRAYKVLTGWHHKFKTTSDAIYQRDFVNDRALKHPVPNWGSKAYCGFEARTRLWNSTEGRIGNLNFQRNEHPNQAVNENETHSNTGINNLQETSHRRTDSDFIIRNAQSSPDPSYLHHESPEIETILETDHLVDPPYKELFHKCEKEIQSKKGISPIWNEEFELLFRIKGDFCIFRELDRLKGDIISPRDMALFKK